MGEDPSELGSAEVFDDKEGDLAEGSVEMETCEFVRFLEERKELFSVDRRDEEQDV